MGKAGGLGPEILDKLEQEKSSLVIVITVFFFRLYDHGCCSKVFDTLSALFVVSGQESPVRA